MSPLLNDQLLRFERADRLRDAERRRLVRQVRAARRDDVRQAALRRFAPAPSPAPAVCC